MRTIKHASIALSLALAMGTAAGDLSLADRVRMQRAIEDVLWAHRTWPAENNTPKPPLASVMSDDAIRAKVDRTLRECNALETLWHRPITSAALQAEIDRMVRDTRDPAMLSELFRALGDDPRAIAETLARQNLADRWIREAYA